MTVIPPQQPSDSTPRSSQADVLLELIKPQGAKFFYDRLNNPFASIPIKKHWETWPLKSRQFRRWLSHIFWRAKGKALSSAAVDSVLGVLEGYSCFDGDQIELHNRIAEFKGDFIYDLSNSTWQVIRVSPKGWTIENCFPILFRRYTHQIPQVLSNGVGSDLQRLLDFINLADKSQQILMLVYVVSCFVPGIPHPIAVCFGPQGSSKTTFSKMLRSIVDPSCSPVLSIPRSVNDLLQQLDHNWLPIYDNIDDITREISDILCRAVTGEGSMKRVLYSDDEDMILSFQRCPILNGINIAAQRPDLLSRSIIFRLRPIGKDERKEERVLWENFNTAKPAILRGIFDALSKAMTIYPTITLKEMPRMADFARWGCAIAEALGSTQEEFLAVYGENIRRQNAEAIEANPVAAAVIFFMKFRAAWEGTASDLLKLLDAIASNERINLRRAGWPGGSGALVRRLHEVEVDLKEQGISLMPHKTNGRKFIEIINASPEIDPIGLSRERQIRIVLSDALPPRVDSADSDDDLL